jgi:hypothetical protein
MTARLAVLSTTAMPGSANYTFDAKKLTLYNQILPYELIIAALVMKSLYVYAKEGSLQCIQKTATGFLILSSISSV